MLNIDEIRSCSVGVMEVTGEGEGVIFHRFSHAARNGYRALGEPKTIRMESPAGVVLSFQTDSPELTLEADLPVGGRKYAYFDVWVDGIFSGCLGGVEALPIRGTLRLGQPGRVREVQVYLPHTRKVVLKNLSLGKGASFVPAIPARPVLLAMGDSITQGMNGHHPALIYPVVAARALGMTLRCGGVGGHVFDAGTLPDRQSPEDPACITVAYGINDFNRGFDASPARDFLRQLRRLYPASPVAVLEPIWASRAGMDHEPQSNAAGIRLSEYREQLRAIVSEFQNMRCLPMAELLPPGPAFLPDGVHPDTAGHVVYGENLARLLTAQSRA